MVPERVGPTFRFQRDDGSDLCFIQLSVLTEDQSDQSQMRQYHCDSLPAQAGEGTLGHKALVIEICL